MTLKSMVTTFFQMRLNTSESEVGPGRKSQVLATDL